MTESFFVPIEEQRARLVQPHAIPYEPTPVWDVPVDLAGVGMLRSSLADMEKLASALAGRRDTPLKDAIALALEPLRPARGRQLHRIRLGHVLARRDAHPLAQRRDRRFARDGRGESPRRRPRRSSS